MVKVPGCHVSRSQMQQSAQTHCTFHPCTRLYHFLLLLVLLITFLCCPLHSDYFFGHLNPFFVQMYGLLSIPTVILPNCSEVLFYIFCLLAIKLPLYANSAIKGNTEKQYYVAVRVLIIPCGGRD